MRPTLLLFTLALCATPEDLKYELAVRDAFVEFEGRVARIADETGTTNPDRLVPVLMERRSLWKNAEGGGFFERLNNGFWVQKLGGTGDAKLYNTSDKTAEYIEIGLVEGGWAIRMYEDHITVKSPNSKDFKLNAKGKWER